MTDTLSLRELSRATLARQMLLRREKASVTTAVERLVALQAQLPRPPYIALFSRLHDFAPQQLSALAHDRKVVRSTLLRCTLHLTSTRDYLILRPLLQPVLSAAMQGVLKDRAQGLDLEALAATARRCLNGTPQTFEALRGRLQAAHPETDERALGYAVRTHLPLVQVPTDTRWGWPGAADFALADEWTGRKVPSEGVLATLVLRYLSAFGPATPADAQAWSGRKGLKEVFEALRPKLVVFRDEQKRELFDLPDAPRPPVDTPAPVRYLPDFDSLVLGHADRTRVVSDVNRPRLATKNLRVLPSFLVDGFVAGLWRLERTRGVATLTVEPFAPLTKKVRVELEEEGAALARFVEPEAKTVEFRVA